MEHDHIDTPPGLAARGLLEPDANGLELPKGFTSRVVARSGEVPCEGSDYSWHGAPDGGACFATEDGGWVYVSNSETLKPNGGVGTLMFSPDGTLLRAYSILSGTIRNCAGGPTPWGTWLSCEEYRQGRVYECDPLGKEPAHVRPQLGVFQHEAAAVDIRHRHVYLTEDEIDGCVYRFTAKDETDGVLNLDEGVLDVMEVKDGSEGAVAWHRVPDPLAQELATRLQVNECSHFKGGEGAWFHEGVVYFTTKFDNRVWALDTDAQSVRIVYDARTSPHPVLTGVDNITVAADGTLLVCEDGGNLEIVTIDQSGAVAPLLHIAGHPASEVTGAAFSPAHDRLYFSSQRGSVGRDSGGITYEVSGPFDELLLAHG